MLKGLASFLIIFTNFVYAAVSVADPSNVNLSTLISNKCLSMNSDHHFFKSLWADDSYRLELNDFRGMYLNSPCLSDADKIHLEIYRQRNKEKIVIPQVLENAFEQMVSLKTLPRKLFQLFISFEEKIEFESGPNLMEFWRSEYSDLVLYFRNVLNPKFIDTAELRDIFFNQPDLSNILNGKYENKIRLFLLCRRNRNYPCLFIAKDKDDNVIQDQSTGKIWSQPALAQSARGLPSNIVNGRTPQGVHTIDSVMPYADQNRSFGKFRRLILNWVPTEDNSDINSDMITKSLLSPLSDNSFWWRQASTSRDIGRSDLRIHGTGKKNDDPHSSYYPLRKSNGCITQREGLYDGVEYKDQRLILDQLMKGLDLAISFDNEEKISGILYVIDLDDKNRPVFVEDVQLKLGLHIDRHVQL